MYECDLCETHQVCDSCLFFVWSSAPATGKVLSLMCPVCVGEKDVLDSKEARQKWKEIMRAKATKDRKKSAYK